MASGHDDHGHDDHGHDDHGHAPESSFFVVPPMIVGVIVAIVLIVLLGTESGAVPFSSPFS
jgi:hypothetical protein